MDYCMSFAEVTLAHFLTEKKPAYVCWFVWMSIGMLAQYAWSTSVCVRHKLYVMIASVTFAIITYGKRFCSHCLIYVVHLCQPS